MKRALEVPISMAALGAEALEQSGIKEVKDLGVMAPSVRIGLIDDAEQWEVYLWGRNLADSDHMNLSLRDFLGTYVAGYAMPRS